MSGQLVVAGTGIGFQGSITLRARAEIESADKVFYLVTEELTAQYISDLNPSAESLYALYSEDCNRIESYQRMVEHIMSSVRSGLHVCAVFYGHPGIFVYPSHECIAQALREGFLAQMLPAVSAEDCLFADLGIDPGRVGCQSYEVNDFLIYQRMYDPCSVLVLWQIGVIGEVGFRKTANRGRGLRTLQDRLLQTYSPEQLAVLYEASEFPTCPPLIERLRLGDLIELDCSPIATLVVPPRERARPNLGIAAAIGIPAEYVKQRSELPECYDPLRPCALGTGF